MGCACGKKRATSYAAPRRTPDPKPDEKPVRVRFLDGEVREYATRIEALAARIIAGGGEILD